MAFLHGFLAGWRWFLVRRSINLTRIYFSGNQINARKTKMKTKTYTVWNRLSLVWLIGLLYGLNSVWAGINPSATWTPTPTSFAYGTALVSGQLLGATGGTTAGSWAFTGPGGASLSVGSFLPAGAPVVNATFTPTDTVTFNVVVLSTTFTVSKVNLTVTSPSVPHVNYGVAPAASYTASVIGLVAGDIITYTYQNSADRKSVV
jgi:hypothetical protein